MIPRADLLFVYGTLLRGAGRAYTRELAPHAWFVGPARAQGRLFDLGTYPALLPSDDDSDQVVGELHALRFPERVLGRLDTYEGPEFERRMRRIAAEALGNVRAWAYHYRRAGECRRRIPHGNYAAWGR